MALPGSRDKTYAASDILNPAHVVAWQDWIRAIHEGRFEGTAQTRSLLALDGALIANVTRSAGKVANSGATPGYFAWPLLYDVGDVFTGYSLMCDPGVAGSLNLSMRKVDLSDGTDTSVVGANSTGTAYAEDCQITGRTDLVESGFVYLLLVTSNNASDSWGGAIVTHVRPPRTT